MKYLNSRHTASRTGMALPMILVCLALAMMIGAAMLQAVVIYHRQAQLIEEQHQTMWLAESAVQQAVYKLQQSAAYRGEIWEVSGETLGRSEGAAVTIQIEPQAQSSEQWKIIVDARYPAQGQLQVSERRELLVAAPVTAKSAAEDSVDEAPTGDDPANDSSGAEEV